MTGRHRFPEMHSLEPIIDPVSIDLNMDFHTWNTLLGLKRKQLGIAQGLGSVALELKDQEDIDLLYSIFPEHHAEFVSIINQLFLDNE